MAAFCRLLALTFTSHLVSAQSLTFAQDQARTPGSSVTFWTPEMRVDDVLSHVHWKHGANMFLGWDNGTIEYYGNATKERTLLDVTNGSLTILALTRWDSGSYTVELNGWQLVTFPLHVISLVSVPWVSEDCRPEGDTQVFCLLTCEGDTAGSGPLRYRWLHAHGNITARTKTINTTASLGVSSVGGFRCTVENDVSTKTSVADPPPPPENVKTGGSPPPTPHPPQQPPPENVKTGDVHHGWKIATVVLIVLLVLLVLVVLLIVFIKRRRAEFGRKKRRRMTPGEKDIELSLQSNGEHSRLNGGPQ